MHGRNGWPAIGSLVTMFGIIACSQPPSAGEEPPWQRTWVTITAPDKRFSVEMPASPKKEVVDAPSAFGPTKVVILAVDTIDYSLLAGYTDYPVKSISRARAESLLTQATEAVRKRPRVTQVVERKITIDGYPGRDLEISFGPEVNCRQRQLMVGARSYLLTVTCPANRDMSPETNRFFKSFKLLKPAK